MTPVSRRTVGRRVDTRRLEVGVGVGIFKGSVSVLVGPQYLDLPLVRAEPWEQWEEVNVYLLNGESTDVDVRSLPR